MLVCPAGCSPESWSGCQWNRITIRSPSGQNLAHKPSHPDPRKHLHFIDLRNAPLWMCLHQWSTALLTAADHPTKLLEPPQEALRDPGSHISLCWLAQPQRLAHSHHTNWSLHSWGEVVPSFSLLYLLSLFFLTGCPILHTPERASHACLDSRPSQTSVQGHDEPFSKALFLEAESTHVGTEATPACS